MFAFKQGEPVRDVVTGFRGFVLVRQDHLTGCNRYYLQPPVGDDGKHPEGVWIDEPTLERDKTRTRIVIEHAAAGDPPG